MIPDVQHHLYGAGTTGQSHRHVHVVLGPQDDYFTPEAVHAFLNTPYRVTAAIDRMGARLAGQALGHVPCKGAEIISDGVVPGAIQVPGDGQPIVLLQDAQTVGGYPKIATIVSADVPVVATAMPGDCIHFKGVPADAAADYSRAAAARLQQLLRRIIPVDTKPKMNLRALYTTNLISGAVDCLAPDHFPSA
jgi:allophanate hydrolase